MGYLLKELGSDILLVENLLEPSLCAHMIQVADCSEFRSPPSGASLTGELRSNEVLPLDNSTPLLASTGQLLLGKMHTIRDLVSKRYDASFSHIELYSIERFQAGQNHKRHRDGSILSNRYEELAQGIPARDATIVGYLNQEFEGGDLLFDRQAVKAKPAAGGAIVFPACYTHPYQALPVLRGCKYTFTCWLIH